MYTEDSNKLAFSTGAEAASYTYDANGSTAADGTSTFEYNAAGRLATVDEGETATYAYDGENRRVLKVSAQGRIYYFYDLSGRLLTEMMIGDPSTSAEGKDYVYLPDAPLARVDWSLVDVTHPCPPLVLNCEPDVELSESDALFYYHTDHLGTPIAMTDGSSALVWKAEYFPFGGMYSASTGDNLRFPGQYFDQETGLHQNWFRDYQPKTGRYLEADPVGQFGGINLYAYALENPVEFFDLLGLVEGSSTNVQKRKAIAVWALAKSLAGDTGSTEYAVDSYLSPQYPARSWKCSGLTCDATANAGAPMLVTVPDGRSGAVTRCPTATEIRHGSIPNWRRLAPSEAAEPGDIFGGSILGPDVGATGHAAVMVSDGHGGLTTVGAHRWRVGPPGKDPIMAPFSYLRYTGD
jgi:RHS repeat-associated protein